MPRLVQDHTTEYARSVVSGETVAGGPVRMACQRHLDDLERGEYFFSRRLAARAFEFFERYLSLEKGEYEGLPFVLLPWQRFVVGSLVGWLERPPTRRRPRGKRRFRTAYIETAKGSGKSPIAAGMALYCTYADGESMSEGYFLAKSREQARVPFEIAVGMVRGNAELNAISKVYGGAHPSRIVSVSRRSFLTRVASAKGGKGHSGPNAHVIVADEMHEWDSPAMLEIYVMSIKQRHQPLIFIITNSGVDKSSPCGVEHDRNLMILRGQVSDDTTFAYVCQLDESDDAFGDESCWIKTNPSLPDIPGYDYIRKRIQGARGLASKESVIYRLIFCRWMEAESPWLRPEVWKACQVGVLTDASFRHKWRKAMAVDLSLKTDFTAIAEVWESPEGELEAKVSIITPHDTLGLKAETDAAPYHDWLRDGHIETVMGSVIEYRDIAERLYTPYWEGVTAGIAYDGWNVEFLLQAMDAVGVPYYLAGRDAVPHPSARAMKMIRHGQGFASGSYAREQGREYLSMPHSINVMEEKLLKKKIRILDNACLTMMAMNAVVVSDTVENRRFNKKAANRRIDGLVALTMAVGLLDMQPKARQSPWNDEGFRFKPFRGE